jgi:hypothetical protein
MKYGKDDGGKTGGLFGVNVRGSVLVLCAFFTTLFLAGCFNPVLPPNEPVKGSHTLLIRISGESSTGKTALPASPQPPAKYNISVIRGETVLGSSTGAVVGATSYAVSLSDDPAVGDVVSVEGLNNDNEKYWEGSYTLSGDITAGDTVSITLSPSSAGTGSIDLIVDFTGNEELTAVELSLYRSLADYEGGIVYQYKRYRKSQDYGAGDELGDSVPINYTNIPSGNYVVKIEFFRSQFVRVSRLVQTIIVRDNLVTEKWDNSTDTLIWDEDYFASSDASLDNISISTAYISFSPTTYSYSVVKNWVSELPILTISGKGGQKIEAKLNGTTNVNSGSLLLLDQNGTNSLVITVTAPDGLTKQIYMVSYTYVYETEEWFVSSPSSTPPGSDTGDGTSSSPYASVAMALTDISNTYNGGSGWPGDSSNPVAARINISGEIAAADISDAFLYYSLPPIILTGTNESTDKIKSSGTTPPLVINNAAVILGDELTLTGGNTSNGGGVYVDGNGSFTMNGGIISGNTATAGGGGVYVAGSGSFTMNGGIIGGTTENKNAATNGGGVFVTGYGSFTMNEGTISGNSAGGVFGGSGGGVYFAGSGSFIMNGGIIGGTAENKNTASSNGGGVYFAGTGEFTMNGGTVSGNSAGGGLDGSGGGGGVYFAGSGSFIMNGGTVSGNSAGGGLDGSGGGVYVTDGNFTMNGQSSVSGNTASGNGGGVYVTGGNFTMNGQSSVSGNSVSSGYGGTSNGGGVYFDGSGNFTMINGTISGNSASSLLNGTSNGGGVYFDGSSTFTMSNGTISGNSANSSSGGTSNGGGVYFASSGSFTMYDGTISGNSASGGSYDNTNNGGGVYVTSGSFAMYNGTISGNSVSSGRAASISNGGGVYFDGSSFTMSNGTISGNSVSTGYGGASKGGGVYFAGSIFTMSNGTISGNSASSGLVDYMTPAQSTNTGGGVYVANGSFAMSNGTISGNSLSSGTLGISNAGGVYFAGTGVFTMSDSASVHTNNSVYLDTNICITLSGALTENPAANIEHPTGAGSQVLGGDISIGDNYTKFLIDGVPDKIDQDGIIVP